MDNGDGEAGRQMQLVEGQVLWAMSFSHFSPVKGDVGRVCWGDHESLGLFGKGLESRELDAGTLGILRKVLQPLTNACAGMGESN